MATQERIQREVRHLRTKKNQCRENVLKALLTESRLSATAYQLKREGGQMSMELEYECPTCGEWIEIYDFQIQGDCIECQNSFTVDRDGEFVNGMWRDRTKLIARPQIPNGMSAKEASKETK